MSCRLHHCLLFLYQIILGVVTEVLLLKGHEKLSLVRTIRSPLFAPAQLETVRVSVQPTRQLWTVEDIIFSDLCNKSISFIKVRRNSIIVPIGALQFGVCRHRALLMKVILLLC